MFQPIRTGPKRRRRTRRELPYGQVSLWGSCYHMRRDRERKRDLDIARTERREARILHPSNLYR